MVVVVMLMLMMGKVFPILYIQTPDRPPQRLLLVIIVIIAIIVKIVKIGLDIAVVDITTTSNSR